MLPREELEALSYRDLQKIAKSRRIRQSGKGITKKRLLSLIIESANMDGTNTLPLQELEVESLHPFSSPEGESFGDHTLSDTYREFNDSNKENTSLRRLTFDVVQPQEQRESSAEVARLPPVAVVNAMERPKAGKRVRITEAPKEANRGEASTPRPSIKIVKTPIPVRKSGGKPVISTQTRLSSLAPNTPLPQKTPRMNKTVALRMASSAKKTEVMRKQSKIPKLDVKKPPNFANIHQSAFDKMDSLWDVEHKRNLRGKSVPISRGLFQTKKETRQPPRTMTFTATPKKLQPTRATSSTASLIPKTVNAAKSIAPLPAKVTLKEAARQAVNKVKPRKVETLKEERRTFLKGVRINRRFQMQMQNRGLI